MAAGRDIVSCLVDLSRAAVANLPDLTVHQWPVDHRLTTAALEDTHHITVVSKDSGHQKRERVSRWKSRKRHPRTFCSAEASH